MRGRSSTDLLGLALLAGLIAGGCRPEPPDLRDARAAVKEFSTALRRHDGERLRAMAACIVSTEGVRDARLRYLEPIRAVRAAALDSLVTLYTEAHRLADSVYAAAPDSAADLESRFERARNLGRRAAATRAARRGAEESRSDGVSSANTELKTIRAHVMVRFAGEAVGPAAIDRDTIVRLVRAPGGVWVVYAFDLASDSPGPLPY